MQPYHEPRKAIPHPWTMMNKLKFMEYGSYRIKIKVTNMLFKLHEETSLSLFINETH